MDIWDTFLICAFFAAAPISGYKYGPLPDSPYHIVWQIASGVDCPLPAINISFLELLEDSGILYNTNDTWEGEYSVILYRGLFGAWPHYLHGEEPPINGGIPQLGNMTRHIDRIKKAVTDAIPDPRFHGVACINMEQFRPLWERNWGDKRVYQRRSRELVEQEYKDMNPSKSWIEEEAIRQFNHHAKQYMVQALRTSRELRPNGLWGYYHFPYCFNTQPVTLHCRETVRFGNDKMRWLWEESTAIMPSIYVFDPQWSTYDVAQYMYANIEEGIRVADLVGGKPVYAYHKFHWQMDLPVSFYNQIKAIVGLRMPADFGIEGVILWGSRSHYETKFDCQRGYAYMRETVIPYSRALMEWVKLCSETRCSGRGRCRHRGAVPGAAQKDVEEVLRDTMEKLMDWTIDERYHCRCYEGYSGDDCGLMVSKGHNLASTLASFLIVVFVMCFQ